jgi:hypothetical protein
MAEMKTQSKVRAFVLEMQGPSIPGVAERLCTTDQLPKVATQIGCLFHSQQRKLAEGTRISIDATLNLGQWVHFDDGNAVRVHEASDDDLIRWANGIECELQPVTTAMDALDRLVEFDRVTPEFVRAFTEREIVVDLEKEAWNAIKAAAGRSPWMPQEYYLNDWVSDVVSFLSEPREAPQAHDEPPSPGM